MKYLSCFDFIALLKYIEGILPDYASQKIEKHLETCDRCMNNLTDLIYLLKSKELSEWRRISPDEAQKIIMNLNFKKTFSEKYIELFKDYFSDFSQNLSLIFEPGYEWSLYLQPEYVKSHNDNNYCSNSFNESSINYIQFIKKFDILNLEFFFEKTSKSTFSLSFEVLAEELYNNIRINLYRENGRNMSRIYKNKKITFDKDLLFGLYHLNVIVNTKLVGNYSFVINTDKIKEKNNKGLKSLWKKKL